MITTVKRGLYTLCDILALIAVLGLVSPPYTYGKNAPPPTVEEDDDGPGRGKGHRADPCDHLPLPPGKAKGIHKKCSQSGSSSGIAKGDFNGDGFGDLAIGVPGEDFGAPPTSPVGDITGAGAVHVIYGSANGLVPLGASGIPASQLWSQSSPGVGGGPEYGDKFGAALAAGEFNGDEFSDLAIGVPGEDLNSGGNTGAVIVIYGSPNGLTGVGDTNLGVPASQFWALSTIPEADPAFLDDAHLGSALAWGDFDGDGIGDLAMGAPDYNQLPPPPATPLIDEGGAVWVLYGANGGLSTTGTQFWTQQSSGVQDTASDFDHFGAALAAGDFNGNGTTDLAIGVPGEGFCLSGNNCPLAVGAVAVLFGQNGEGLTADNDLFFSSFDFHIISPPDIDIPSFFSVNTDDQFGQALAAGDFNGDNRADLAIAVPEADIGASTAGGQLISGSKRNNVGAVFVVYGTDTGLSPGAASSQFWDQNKIFGPGRNETGDQTGRALAAGDFDGDGRADLAIGAPYENVASSRTGTSVNYVDAGAVFVVYGSTSGLSTTGRAPQTWHQDTTGINDVVETGDLFGFSLTAWNFGRNQVFPGIPRPLIISTADLAIGVPFEDLGSNSQVLNAGAINVIYGTDNGLNAANNQFLHQDTPGILTDPEENDFFGLVLY
jgi:hypothetical protein